MTAINQLDAQLSTPPMRLPSHASEHRTNGPASHVRPPSLDEPSSTARVWLQRDPPSCRLVVALRHQPRPSSTPHVRNQRRCAHQFALPALGRAHGIAPTGSAPQARIRDFSLRYSSLSWWQTNFHILRHCSAMISHAHTYFTDLLVRYQCPC